MALFTRAHKSTRRALPAMLVVLAVVAGCGESGPPRYDVSGTITFDGQAVPAGTIIFTPDVSRGGRGPQGRAEIRDGSFSTAKGGLGILDGPHVLEIRGTDGVPFEGEEETIREGKPLFPPVQAAFELAQNDATIQIDVHAEAGKYRADVRRQDP